MNVQSPDESKRDKVSVIAFDQLVVSKLKAVSHLPYFVERGLSEGKLVYTDETFNYTGVPAFIKGSTYIRTANTDKTLTETSALSFTVNQKVTVYVGYDSRATTLPGWLSGWTDTSQTLATTDTTLISIRKTSLPVQLSWEATWRWGLQEPCRTTWWLSPINPEDWIRVARITIWNPGRARHDPLVDRSQT